MIVLSRYLQEKGIAVSELGILDCLSLVGSTGRGAFGISPPTEVLAMRAKYPILKSWRSILNLVLSEKECRDIETLYLVVRQEEPSQVL